MYTSGKERAAIAGREELCAFSALLCGSSFECPPPALINANVAAIIYSYNTLSRNIAQS